ncbi:Transposase [Botrimarina mediterranea]|uniref:Transposase n=2 Tax=Botrimarina mediterranea TaxID=2528022 RepID=A0A518K286_9BACT|nr:Transposase [Botrimarina mediterranea]
MRSEEALRAIAMACGGLPGARLANRLGMVTSGDSLLRLLRRGSSETPPCPRVLGVDDFAFRKRSTYGTILCDLVRRRPVDLLPERSKESLSAWLLKHPGVEVISRDRGEYYRQGASEGAPEAIQVADRWHLLGNLREALARWLGRCSGEWRVAAAGESASSHSGVSTVAPPQVTKGELSTARRELRLQRYEESRRLSREGLDNRQIGRLLGLHAVTVRKFIEADSFPERVDPARTRLTDAFLEHLKKRWEQGCHVAQTLYSEIRSLGYVGSYDAVRRRVAPWRDAARDRKAAVVAGSCVASNRLSADQLAWLLVQPSKDRTAEGEAVLHRLSLLGESWSKAIELARAFPEAMRDQDGAAFDGWLERALREVVPREVRRFAQGLTRDLAAVRMAFTSSWSNGQTEGHVNRLKTIKRQMYGRASFDLLRIRFLNAA